MDKRETAIEILELFEELLDRYEIDIPDEDREGHPTEARIYGKTWYDLEDSIVKILNEREILDNDE
jgi:hypothetical protein